MLVSAHRQKEDFFKKRRNVPFELQKGMSMIIITVKHKFRISLLELVVSTISFISSKKRNHFLSHYFRRVVILGETESIKLLTPVKFYRYFGRVATSGSRYFGNFTVFR